MYTDKYGGMLLCAKEFPAASSGLTKCNAEDELPVCAKADPQNPYSVQGGAVTDGNPLPL